MSARSGWATVGGVVVDSLRGGFVPGAVIGLESGSRMALSDSLGRFVLDSISPGQHRLVLMDAILDTLSLSVVTAPMTLAAGDTAFVIMAIPSAETVIAAKCGSGPFPLGSSVVLGLVIDAETEQPVSGADVVLAWSEVQASREVGLRTIPRQRSSKSGGDGAFRICGLPSDVSGDLVAWTGRDTTAAIPFAMRGSALAIRTLALPGGVGPPDQPGAAVTGSGARMGRSVISGTVQDLSGRPISDARVSLHGSDAVAMTNERGEFILRGARAGSQTVLIRKLGHEPAEFGVNLSPSRPVEVTVDLAEFVPVLSTVVVRAQMDVALDRVGYTRRKQVGMGRFMGMEEIERRNAMRLTDVLAEFPMLQLLSMGGSERRVTGRMRGMGSSCVTFYVDGIAWMGDDSPVNFMHPQEIGAIEAYSAGTTPAEFSRSMNACETVVIWTRHHLGARR